MRVLNIGSLNLDYVYRVPHFVQPGESLAAEERFIACGGKGLNQSVAMARAGLTVFHAGIIGHDGQMLADTLIRAGVDTGRIERRDVPSGHTVIQVDPAGQNCIIIFGGTNKMFTRPSIEAALDGFGPGDLLLLQNEVNGVDVMMRLAGKKGMRIAFNPSPFDASVFDLPLETVDYLIVNETEGRLLSGETEIDAVIPALRRRYPHMKILLTLGEDGSLYDDGERLYRQAAVKADAVDTTGAGDTFLGFFLAGEANGLPVERTLERASAAAAIAVSRKGAADSIPSEEEVDKHMTGVPVKCISSISR